MDKINSGSNLFAILQASDVNKNNKIDKTEVQALKQKLDEKTIASLDPKDQTIVRQILSASDEAVIDLEFGEALAGKDDTLTKTNEHCNYSGADFDPSKEKTITLDARFGKDGMYDYGVTCKKDSAGKPDEVTVFCNQVKGILSKDTIINDVVGICKDTNLLEFLKSKYPTPESLVLLPAKVVVGKDDTGSPIIKTFSNDDKGRLEFLEFSSQKLKDLVLAKLKEKPMDNYLKDFDDMFKLQKTSINGQDVWVVIEDKKPSDDPKPIEGKKIPGAAIDIPSAPAYSQGDLQFIPRNWHDAGGVEGNAGQIRNRDGKDAIITRYAEKFNHKDVFEVNFFARQGISNDKITLNFTLDKSGKLDYIDLDSRTAGWTENPLGHGTGSEITKDTLLRMISTDLTSLATYDGYNSMGFQNKEMERQSKGFSPTIKTALTQYYLFMCAQDDGYKGNISDWLKEKK